ncbi:hypothetical protein B0H12DRAFT_444886 [Mycena haematopus]|nr:hypothetical protein B0H12DRAFT_444886 [Mycena haematopus]
MLVSVAQRSTPLSLHPQPFPRAASSPFPRPSSVFSSSSHNSRASASASALTRAPGCTDRLHSHINVRTRRVVAQVHPRILLQGANVGGGSDAHRGGARREGGGWEDELSPLMAPVPSPVLEYSTDKGQDQDKGREENGGEDEEERPGRQSQSPAPPSAALKRDDSRVPINANATRALRWFSLGARSGSGSRSGGSGSHAYIASVSHSLLQYTCTTVGRSYGSCTRMHLHPPGKSSTASSTTPLAHLHRKSRTPARWCRSMEGENIVGHPLHLTTPSYHRHGRPDT